MKTSLALLFALTSFSNAFSPAFFTRSSFGLDFFRAQTLTALNGKKKKKKGKKKNPAAAVPPPVTTIEEPEEVPVVVVESDAVEEPAPIKGPEPEEAVAAEDPVAIEEPAPVEEAETVAVEEPAPVEEEEPKAEEPEVIAAEEPVAVEEPAPVEDAEPQTPVAVEEPAPVEEPVLEEPTPEEPAVIAVEPETPYLSVLADPVIVEDSEDGFSWDEKQRIINNVFECHGFFPDLRSDEELPESVRKMRQQPKPAAELAKIKAKYEAAGSEADAAFAILCDLGLMEDYDVLGEYTDDFDDYDM